MDIRLIAMDLDGTALRPDRRSFSPRLIRALEQAHTRGIRIVPVTGRQFGTLPPILQIPPAWADLAVLCNGAQIRQMNSGKILCQNNICPNALQALLQLAQTRDLAIEFSVDSILHLTSRSLQLQQGIDELFFHLDTILARHGKIMDSLDPLCTMPVEKVNLPYVPKPLRLAVEADLKEMEISAVWSSSISVEITHPAATKGNALTQLSQLTGIPTANMMALGDSGNDESMLRTAGWGVAMGNAPERIKVLADAVTETNENDGAAIAIERFVLSR